MRTGSKFLNRFFGRNSLLFRMIYWKTPKRYNYPLEAVVNPFRGRAIRGQIFDISETGFFLPVDPKDKLDLAEGDSVNLRFALNTLRQIRCEGVVARSVAQPDTYPRGYGIQFTTIAAEDKRRLKQFLRDAA